MTDFSIGNDRAAINRDLDVVLQQIDILFDTVPGEVFGQESYGTDYERFLWDLQISSNAIQTQILSDIRSLNLMGFVPQVDVLLMQGTERDIIIVDIFLRRSGYTFEKTYKIR